MIRYLAESEHYKVFSEWETVYLLHKANNTQIIIGDFYGDPDDAIISLDEKYVVMCGCGLIIYYLNEPFADYNYNMETPQFKEFFRDPKNIGWIDTAYQAEMDQGCQFFRYVTADLLVFRMNVETLEYEQLSVKD